MSFQYLFSPLKIRHVTIPNRIVTTAHATAFNPLGHPSDQFIAYTAEKARNGCGLIITMGSGSVHPTSPNSDWGGINNWDDSIIPYLKKMSAAVKQHGAVLMAQISHRGRRVMRDVTWLPTYAPSDIPEPMHYDIPHEIHKTEIPWLVEAYAKAAWRLKEGGFDGVEISAAHGHLIDQFWSPYSNKRTDEFGGSLENRMRFGLMVLHAVREAVGEDFIVALRISSDEMVENGLTHEDLQEILLHYVATGKIDLITTGTIIAATEEHQQRNVPSMNYPTGLYVPYSASYKQRLLDAGYDIPIIAVGRIVHPVQAEEILASGQADLVAMTRAIIADHELPKKAKEGRLDDIRLCMGANEGCIGRLYRGKPITCVQNPVIGREEELARLEPAKVQRRVLVVGGGPGGLEAARMAALRGHRVVLVEKSEELGGSILLAAKQPNREAYRSSVSWLESQVKKVGVEIRLGTTATVDSILEENPDVVIIATGSRPRSLDIPGARGSNVISAREVLAGTGTPGHRVLLIDEQHGMEGLPTAEFLAERGHEVVAISRLWIAGEAIDGTLRPDLYARLDTLGVQVFSSTNALEIFPDGRVRVEHYHSHREWEMGPFDTIVVAAGGKAEDELWRSLVERPDLEVHCIGDAFAPRGLHDALLEGTRVARSI